MSKLGRKALLAYEKAIADYMALLDSHPTTSKALARTRMGGEARLNIVPAQIIAPNVVDHVTFAWRKYQQDGGRLGSVEWHQRHAPKHNPCNMCHA